MLLPFTFLKFWYTDAPREILGFLASFNIYFMELFALPLCLRTFFKPLKNEYREGLVGFSIAMGILFKTVLILIDLIILAFILIFECLVLLSFLVFPVITVLLLFF